MLLYKYYQYSLCGRSNKVETKPCKGLPKGYSAFSSWSKCSATCGNGYQTRFAVSLLLVYSTIVLRSYCNYQ